VLATPARSLWLSVTPELTRFSQLPQFAPVQDFHALVTLFFNPHSAQSSFSLSEYSTPCAKIFLPPFFCHDILVCSVASCSKSALSVKSVVTNLCVLCGYSRFWLRLRCFAVFVAILASGEWSGTRGPKGSQTGSRNQNRNSICWILAKAAVAKARGQRSVVSGQWSEGRVQSPKCRSRERNGAISAARLRLVAGRGCKRFRSPAAWGSGGRTRSTKGPNDRQCSPRSRAADRLACKDTTCPRSDKTPAWRRGKSSAGSNLYMAS
jgi:hypothetical protein